MLWDFFFDMGGYINYIEIKMFEFYVNNNIPDNHSLLHFHFFIISEELLPLDRSHGNHKAQGLDYTEVKKLE